MVWIVEWEDLAELGETWGENKNAKDSSLSLEIRLNTKQIEQIKQFYYRNKCRKVVKLSAPEQSELMLQYIGMPATELKLAKDAWENGTYYTTQKTKEAVERIKSSDIWLPIEIASKIEEAVFIQMVKNGKVRNVYKYYPLPMKYEKDGIYLIHKGEPIWFEGEPDTLDFAGIPLFQKKILSTGYTVYLPIVPIIEDLQKVYNWIIKVDKARIINDWTYYSEDCENLTLDDIKSFLKELPEIRKREISLFTLDKMDIKFKNLYQKGVIRIKAYSTKDGRYYAEKVIL